MALTPTRYGVAFGKSFLMQGGALLHVYTDGSVLLTHGGMEIGQGLHTKMVQVLMLLQNARSCLFYLTLKTLILLLQNVEIFRYIFVHIPWEIFGNIGASYKPKKLHFAD